MKRVTALLMALAMLLASVSACGESMGSQLVLSKMKLTNEVDKSSVRLKHLELVVAVGSAAGLPTVQTTLCYGDGQELDFILQVDGSRLLLAMGGISGTYYIDLQEAMGDSGALAAVAVGSGIQMFAANPELLLQMVSTRNSKGYYVWKIKVTKAVYKAVMAWAERMLGSEWLEMVNADGEKPRKRISRLILKYNPEREKLYFYVRRGSKGMRLYARTSLVTEPMELVNLTTDEYQYNLLEMDDKTVEDLRGEFGLLGLKTDSFTTSTHLDELAD